MVQYSNVTVNFNVNVDASGNITVFGSGPDTPSNIIIAKGVIPVEALYNASSNSGLIEFWEPSTQLGDISVQLANSNVGGNDFTDVYKYAAKNLAYGFQKILCDEFDCSAAYPFASNSKYTGQSNYTTNSDFGRFALSVYADALFGHAAATAAITNDTTFMKNMLSLSSDTYVKSDSASIASARYGDWSKSGMVDASDVLVWNAAQSSSDANLAVALTKAIIQKGLLSDGSLAVSSVNSVTSSANKDTLAYIVKQVIGQDASRAMGVDNNELEPDMHQLLRFYSGDKIYVQITLQKPLVTVAPSSASYQKAYDAIDALFTEGDSYKYALEITLGSSSNTHPITITITSASYDGSILTFDYTSTADFTNKGDSYFYVSYTSIDGIHSQSSSISSFGSGSGQKTVSISANGIQSFLIFGTDGIGEAGEYSVLFTDTLNIPQSLAAPNITYTTSSVTLTAGTAMTSLTPNSTGGAVASYSADLPPGLYINLITGEINGTPLTVQSATNLTITATNASGSSTFVISFTVNAATLLTITEVDTTNKHISIAFPSSESSNNNNTFNVQWRDDRYSPAVWRNLEGTEGTIGGWAGNSSEFGITIYNSATTLPPYADLSAIVFRVWSPSLNSVISNIWGTTQLPVLSYPDMNTETRTLTLDRVAIRQDGGAIFILPDSPYILGAVTVTENGNTVTVNELNQYRIFSNSVTVSNIIPNINGYIVDNNIPNSTAVITITNEAGSSSVTVNLV